MCWVFLSNDVCLGESSSCGRMPTHLEVFGELKVRRRYKKGYNKALLVVGYIINQNRGYIVHEN